MGSSVVEGSLRSDAEVVVAIMAGGQGTRFWPLSREAKPKQYLDLSGGGGESLIQQTVSRLSSLHQKVQVLVVTGQSQIPLVKKHVPEVAILAEPTPRNTAACVGFAATFVKSQLGDIPMLFLPADHVIHNHQEMVNLFQRAIDVASKEDLLVTLGITPSYPETGYGYILGGTAHSGASDCFEVERFVEKPNEEKAKEYLASGNYYWNSGMFAWRPSSILSALKSHLPNLFEKLKQIDALGWQDSAKSEIEALFSSMEKVSIDVGVLEKARNVVVMPAKDLNWSDVGSWSSWIDCVGELGEFDSKGNVSRGNVVLHDCNSTGVYSTKRFVAAVGVSDLIIVETEDAILVCDKNKAQDVKKIVEKLREGGHSNLL